MPDSVPVPGTGTVPDAGTVPDVAHRSGWPSVGVVIATRNRPNLLDRAIESIRAQDYPGPLRVVVVFDGFPPDWRLARNDTRPVLVLENWRQPGLCGARNTGILAVGDCELVALCDDADTWAPHKLTTQVLALRPDTLFVTCASEVEYDGRRKARLVKASRLTIDDVARGRAADLPCSGFLARYEALATSPARGGIGLLAENGPAGREMWDLLMRAARRAPFPHVDSPLVRILWRAPHTDQRNLGDHVQALLWLLRRHPEIRNHPRAAARVYGELACWYAIGGDHGQARAWTRAALRHRWWTRPSALALIASRGLLARPKLLSLLSRMR